MKKKKKKKQKRGSWVYLVKVVLTLS
jgi:hypothetical protein